MDPERSNWLLEYQILYNIVHHAWVAYIIIFMIRQNYFYIYLPKLLDVSAKLFFPYDLSY